MNDRTIFRLQDIRDAIDQIDLLLSGKTLRIFRVIGFCVRRSSDFWKFSAKRPDIFLLH